MLPRVRAAACFTASTRSAGLQGWVDRPGGRRLVELLSGPGGPAACSTGVRRSAMTPQCPEWFGGTAVRPRGAVRSGAHRAERRSDAGLCRLGGGGRGRTDVYRVEHDSDAARPITAKSAARGRTMALTPLVISIRTVLGVNMGATSGARFWPYRLAVLLGAVVAVAGCFARQPMHVTTSAVIAGLLLIGGGLAMARSQRTHN